MPTKGYPVLLLLLLPKGSWLVPAFFQRTDIVPDCLLDVGDSIVLSSVYPCAGASHEAQDSREAELGDQVAGQEALKEGGGQQGAILRRVRIPE